MTNVNPLTVGSRTCPWTDPNKDGIAQPSEIGTAARRSRADACTTPAPNGPRWPYSDEVTAGIEQQIMKDMRVGVMYYHRTNRDQIGIRNTAVPSSFYTPITVTIPNGPGGTVANPKPTTATVYNLQLGVLPEPVEPNVIDNQPYLDTDVQRRRVHRQQADVESLADGRGLHLRQQQGRPQRVRTGQSTATTADLNDPNIAAFTNGIVGNDSTWALRVCRAAISCRGAINLAADAGGEPGLSLRHRPSR